MSQILVCQLRQPAHHTRGPSLPQCRFCPQAHFRTRGLCLPREMLVSLADTLAALHLIPPRRCFRRFQALLYPQLSFPARVHLYLQLKRKSSSVLRLVLRYKFDTGAALSSRSRQALLPQYRATRGESSSANILSSGADHLRSVPTALPSTTIVPGLSSSLPASPSSTGPPALSSSFPLSNST